MSETMQEEMLEKLRDAGTAEEIIAIAKEYGQEITEEKAGELLDRLNVSGGGMPDDALEAVTGGENQNRNRQKAIQDAVDMINGRTSGSKNA